MTRGAIVRRTCLLLLLGAAACQKRSEPATQAPGADAAGPGRAHTLESLQQDLARNNGELSLVVDAQRSTSEPDAMADQSKRCERISTLQEAICGLADSICALADEHPDEPRYAESCTSARSDCEHATEVRDACEV